MEIIPLPDLVERYSTSLKSEVGSRIENSEQWKETFDFLLRNWSLYLQNENKAFLDGYFTVLFDPVLSDLKFDNPESIKSYSKRREVAANLFAGQSVFREFLMRDATEYDCDFLEAERINKIRRVLVGSFSFHNLEELIINTKTKDAQIVSRMVFS